MTERDYAAEMRAVIDAETGEGPYVPRIAAEHVVAKLRAVDPDLLRGWLESQAEHFVWQAINDRDRSARSHVRKVARRAEFRQAAEAHSAGDSTALTRFMDLPCTVEDGSRKRLAALTRADLVFVADDYDRRASDNAMQAAFLRALGKKLKTGETVADRYTEDALAAMWQSLSGRAA